MDPYDALVVVDDREHLGPHARSEIAGLLNEFSGISLLVTARRRLYLSGEAALLLGPLDAPEALRMFTEAAAAAGGPLPELRADGGAGTADLRARVTDLCDRLDAIPGALRHAANRLGSESLEAVLEDPLASPAGSGPLTDAERAYLTCDLEERLLWERLSVFEGRFDLAAVQAVCASGALPVVQVLAAFDRLAPCLLLADAEGRYRMPVAARTTGKARLDARGDRWAVVLHHRRHYAWVAEEAAVLWRAGRHREAEQRALSARTDLYAAMNPGTAPLSPAAEAETASGIAVSLWFLWATGDRGSDGRQHLERALDATLGPRPARALWLLAYLMVCNGDLEAADPVLAEAWPLAVRDGDSTCIGQLAQVRGIARLWAGEAEEAATEFAEALELLPRAPAFGPGKGMTVALLALALVQAEPEAAMDVLATSGEWTPAAPDAQADAWTRFVLAEISRWEGDPLRARRYAAQAVRLMLGLRDGRSAEVAGELVADIELGLGNHRAAARLLGASARSGPEAPAQGPVPARVAQRHTRRWEKLRSLLGEEQLRREQEHGAREGLHVLIGQE
ncbi:tetratricopeptide repeat protein [Streptomyces sp. NPDC002809]|uniref:tetratricopeptide repeat protein n=1 Tax=Streptomyces sp. NPDC002809 TaxID=3154433 RepID=UPI0033245873